MLANWKLVGALMAGLVLGGSNLAVAGPQDQAQQQQVSKKPMPQQKVGKKGQPQFKAGKKMQQPRTQPQPRPQTQPQPQ